MGIEQRLNDACEGLEAIKDVSEARKIIAQQRLLIGNLNERIDILHRADGVVKAVERLILAKGRYHTEQNYSSLVLAYDAYIAGNAKGAV